MSLRACLFAVATIAWLAACGDAAPPVQPAAPVAAESPAPAPSIPAAPAAGASFLPLEADVIGFTDTLATLQARHGAANVLATKVPGAEGEELDGWVLFPDDPARRGHVYLDDDGRPTMVRVLDASSRWQRADGIRMGLTLAELAQRNGAPVGFMGFDWDYGGGITDWNGGTFARDPPLGMVTLCPPTVDDPGADYPAGDAQFDSNHAWVVAHPPVVCGFSVSLPAP